jgi:hypothetical protein
MHSLSFERREDGWDIYLLGRDKPIGGISRYSVSGDGWFGKMSIDGRLARLFGGSPQEIIDEFEAWVAAGMPPESPLLKFDIREFLLDEDHNEA